jgi:hypothetical protein
MDRRLIALIWLGGIVLMVAIYAIGPQHFIAVCEQFIADTVWWLSDLIDTLMVRAFEVVRAAAIAMFVVFIVLAVVGMRRGLHSGGMLFGVTLVFLLLVRTDWYGSNGKWFAAAILTAVGAGVVTKRLIQPPRPGAPPGPWGAASRGGERPGAPWPPSRPPQ